MLKHWWNLFKKQEVVAITFLNSIGITVRLLTALGSAKLLAFFLGASGMAIMGNLRNALASLDAFSSFGFSNGIVQFVATHKHDKAQIQRFINMLLSFMLLILLLFSIGIICFRTSLNTYLFDNSLAMSSLFIVIAFTFPLQVVNGVFIAFLTGLEQFKKLIYLNIIGNIAGLALSVFLVYYYHLHGALISICVSPALLFFVSYYWVRKDLKLKWEPFHLPLIKPLFSYSLMTLYTAVISPLVFLWIRQIIVKKVGWNEAGYWEGIQRISGIYMLFITTLVFTYFLPKLSAAEEIANKKKWIKQYLIQILPLFVLGLLLLYIIKNQIISLVLNDSFLPMSNYMLWQLIGDAIKSFALIFGLLFFTQRLVIAYLFTETLFFATFYFFAQKWIATFGVEGATKAYAFAYIVYALVLVVYFSWYFSRIKIKSKN